MSSSNELAQDRTDWAEDRTILANERTFAGWMRTGMASVALAVGLRAVFGEFEPTWAAKAIATIFIILAVYIFWAAQEAACKTLGRLNDNEAHAQPMNRMRILSIVFGFGAIAVGSILWASVVAALEARSFLTDWWSDRVRSSVRPLRATFSEAAGRYGDQRIGSKSLR